MSQPLSISKNVSRSCGMKRNESSRAGRQIRIAADVDIVEARMAARVLAAELGFDGADLVMIATAVSEIARNIVEYAKPGEVWIAPAVNGSRRGMEVVAKDRGPGIADGRPGDGGQILHGARAGHRAARIAPVDGRFRDRFQGGYGHDDHDEEVAAEMNPQIARAAERRHRVDCGVNVVACAGERESGDQYLIQPVERGAVIAVADGIGMDRTRRGQRGWRSQRFKRSWRNQTAPSIWGCCCGVAMTRCERRAEWSWAWDASMRGRSRGSGRGISPAWWCAEGPRGRGSNRCWCARGWSDIGCPRTADGDQGPARRSAGGGDGWNRVRICGRVVGRFSGRRAAGADPEWISARHSKPSDDGMVLVARYTGG